MTDTSIITMWHKAARPQPTKADFNVQLGCHLEEFAEMLDTLDSSDAKVSDKISSLSYMIAVVAQHLKDGSYNVDIMDRKDFLDSCCDQIVTVIGAAYCANMNVDKGLDIVNTSNWSKFDSNGKPYLSLEGKVQKGPKYVPPYLEECV